MVQQIIDGIFDTITVNNALKIPNVTGNLAATQPVAAGSIAYNPASNQLIVSDGSTWMGSGSASGVVLIYQPGYTGSSPYIFPTWEALYTVHQSIEGHKTIQFMGSVGHSLVITPGTYDMSDTDWVVCQSMFVGFGMYAPRQIITIQDGATFSHPMCSLSGIFAIEYQGTTSPAMTIDLDVDLDNRGFWISNGAAIFCTGTQPFFNIVSSTPGSLFILVLAYGANIINLGGGQQVIAADSNVVFIINVISSNVIFTDDVLSGAGTFFFIIASRDFQKAQDVLFTVPTIQPQVTGTMLYQDKFSNTPSTYVRSVAPTVNDDFSAFYKVGDEWVNSSANDIYFLVDSTVGAAVWKGPY